MKKTGIESKTKTSFCLVICILISTIIISYILSIKTYRYNKNIPTVNNARVLTNEIINYIEGNYEDIYNENNYSKNSIDNISESKQKDFYYMISESLKKINCKMKVIDIYGKVIFDSEDDDISSKEVYTSIKNNIGYDMSFKSENPEDIKVSLPVVVGDEQRANAVFIIPYDEIMEGTGLRDISCSFIPIIIGFIISTAILVNLKIRISKDIIMPLNELNKAADEFAKGNLDNKIKYNDSTELSKFCGNFEFMRDEFKNSIQQQRELEKAHRELIACISHDLRTPISSIKAYVEGIRDGIAKDPIKLQKYLSIIGKKTDSLSKLINDLFQYSQAEIGELKMKMEEQYSRDLLHRILYPIKIELKNSPLNLYIEERMPNVLIKIDALRLEQVITNLIQNSKKYTPSEGSVYFSVSVDEEFLKITIKDTGIGISPQDLPFIFDRFYRGEKSRSRDYGGAGLGLSICKHIIEAHGGKIYVESMMDKGSVFSFTIPKV